MMLGFVRLPRLSGSSTTVVRTLRVLDDGRHTGRAACLVFLAAMLVTGGCGGPDGRQAIEGTVTFDGKPLEKGQITFTPQAGTNGPTAGAEIVDGKFSVPAAGGPFAGRFRVEITASRPGSQKVTDRFTGKPVNSFEQFIPKKYNTESQLDADVKAGATNRFEFAVSSD